MGFGRGGKERQERTGEERGHRQGAHIFIASSCSFFGIISSICGASKGYVVTSWVRIARWTEDLTLDFEPGEMLGLLALKHLVDWKETNSFLNILAD